MQPVTLNAQNRTSFGKVAGRQARRNENVPAVIYGRHVEPLPVYIKPDDLKKAVSTPHKRNTLLDLDVEGKHYKVVLQDIQFNSVNEDVIHVDFYAVTEGQKIDFDVPLTLTGRSIGVVKGGTLHQPRRVLKVNCLPEDVPEVITLDVTELEIGDKKTIGDLAEIKGVTFRDPASLPIAQIKVTRVVEEKPVEAAEAAAVPAEGQPAAESAAPAKSAKSAKSE
ncbi:MAG: 50S ribosomal protein L25 [Myxococcales bacterium]|nr:MAG: 50S ribosomal protein L25 [Myxococcales bacterium]